MNKEVTTSPRENKSAKIKLSILQTTLSLIGKKSFDKVHVNQICEIVGISKVTFFKYFPQKEDILRYYLRVWSFERCVELSRDHKSGIEGIRFLFEKVCQSYERNPGIMLGLIGYISHLKLPIRPYPFKSVEREMMFPEIENISEISILSLDQLFENFILEAILKKEITRTSNTKQLVHLLDTILYGTIMTAHIHQVQFPSVLFKHNVTSVLESLRQSELYIA